MDDDPLRSRLAVSPDQKVATVLAEHPELVETFIRVSPAFRRLENRVMRKTFARLVTVGQAAAVGGVSVRELVSALNEALGVTVESEDQEVLAAMDEPKKAAGGGQEPEWVRSAEPVEELDVRPYQERGEDPFAAIMEVTDRMSEGEAFRLRNTFEPFPLYDVLERKGFVHWAEQLGERDWLITFRKEGPAVAGAGDEPRSERDDDVLAADAPPSETDVDVVVTIELEDLVPPTPLEKVLEGLASVPPGGLLLVHHRRWPAHLFSKLEEQGHGYRVWDLGPDSKEIVVRKAAE